MIRLDKAEFNKETGISTVTIRTPLGKFTGHAKVHPEDVPYASNITGCRYADQRAKIKYLKAKARVISNEIKALNDFKNVLTSLENVYVSETDIAFNYLCKQIEIKNRERQTILERIGHIKESIQMSIAAADAMHKNGQN